MFQKRECLLSRICRSLTSNDKLWEFKLFQTAKRSDYIRQPDRTTPPRLKDRQTEHEH